MKIILNNSQQGRCHRYGCYGHCHNTFWRAVATKNKQLVVVVVVVVMTSPSGIAYMGGQRCPAEMRNSTRL